MVRNSLYLLLLFSMLVSSCSIQRRKYNKGFYISKTTNVKKGQEIVHDPVSDRSAGVLMVNESKPMVVTPSIEKDKTVDTAKCDKIIFRDSHQEEVMVKEINNHEIKYRKCGFEDGPLYTISPAKVSAILYRNGTKEFYGNYVEPEEEERIESEEYINGYTTWASDPREIEIFSVLSLVFGLFYFIPGLSIVFGLIGLKMFKKEPGKYKGKGFAYAGIIAGALGILLILLVLLI